MANVIRCGERFSKKFNKRQIKRIMILRRKNGKEKRIHIPVNKYSPL